MAEVVAAIAGKKEMEAVAGESDANKSPDENDQLLEVDLLDECNRLENDNLGLRQRLAKLELQTLQKEHGDHEEELNDDSRLATVTTPSSFSYVESVE